MTPLAGLNRATVPHQEAHAQPDAHTSSRKIGQTATPVPDDSAAIAARSRRRGSAMGAYRTRTNPAADRWRHVLSEGEPWDCLTISPS
jgi:hypothetical protein